MTLHIKANNPLHAVIKNLSRRILLKNKIIWHLIFHAMVFLKLKRRPHAVFIVGSGRSGTDILVDCLSHSMNVKTINEYNELAFENWRLKDIPVVMRAVESAGAPIVVLKPIVETMRIRELLSKFPNSKAVFIFRNFQDAINSQIRFFGESNRRAVQSWIETDFENFPLIPNGLKSEMKQIWQSDQSQETASGIYWLAYNSSYLFLNLDENQNIMLVNYESLVEHPEKTLKNLCDFIGLKFKPSMISNIYSSSVSRNTIPNLTPDIQLRCEQTWSNLSNLLDK